MKTTLSFATLFACAITGTTLSAENANTPPVIVHNSYNEIIAEAESLNAISAYLNGTQGNLAQDIDPERVVMRDAKSYCAILLDDNNRKPICRLLFNTKRHEVIFVDKARTEDRCAISKLTDIFKLADKLRNAVKMYSAEV